MVNFKKWLTENTAYNDESFNEVGIVLYKNNTIELIEHNLLLESDKSRYSIEVNYKSGIDEVLKAFAKISLGYVSASMKKKDMHVRHVFNVSPPRIIVSPRGFYDGEPSGIIAWNANKKAFFIADGIYDKEFNTIKIRKESIKKCEGTTAAEIAKELADLMEDVKERPSEIKLRGVKKKRGPKKQR